MRQWGWPLFLALALGLTPPVAAQDESGEQAEGSQTRVLDAESLAHSEAEPIAIEKVSHVDYALVLIAEDGRTFQLPDGDYRSDEGVRLIVEAHRVAAVIGCPGPKDACRFEPHAVRLVDGQVSLIGEVLLPDGVYQRSDGVTLEVEAGTFVEYRSAAP